jgi:hypothetical protein
VYHPPTQTYYLYEITNCGGPSGCDIHVHSIEHADATGSYNSISWDKAGPYLDEFEHSLLPTLRQSISAQP